MGIDDKTAHEMQDVEGKAKAAFGDATDNDELQAEGQRDQAVAKVKKAVDEVQDKVHDAFN